MLKLSQIWYCYIVPYSLNSTNKVVLAFVPYHKGDNELGYEHQFSILHGELGTTYIETNYEKCNALSCTTRFLV
jgi:hypothetical protein